MIPKELLNQAPMTGNERLGQHRESDYLGAEDIDPGTEPVLTIAEIYYARITLQRGKEFKDVITFAEESVPGLAVVRPLVVNATNRKTLKALFGGTSAEVLKRKRIQLYIEHGVRDPSTGDKVDGIRIRKRVPAAPTSSSAPPVCDECGQPITDFGRFSAEEIKVINVRRFGKPLCATCSARKQKKQEEHDKKDETTEQPGDSASNNEEGE